LLLPALPIYAWGIGAAALLAIVLGVRAAGAEPALEDGQTQPPGPPPLLKEGSSGPWVTYLQARLSIGTSGIFDAATKAAVIAFQSANGLTADGIVGPKSWGALGVAGAAPAPSPGGGAPAPKPKPQPAPEPGPAPAPTVGNPFGLSEGIADREAQIMAHVQAGNLEHQWVPIEWDAAGHHVKAYVSRRALALADGTNKLIVSTTYRTAQKIADMIGGALLTTRISDEIAKQAPTLVLNSAGVPPSQNWVTDGTMSKTGRMYEQSNFLEKKVAGAQGLVANEGKDWVLTRRFWPPPAGVGSGGKPYSNSANFGWYYNPPMGSSHSPGGASVVQSIGMVHDMNHADYSQLLRFVRPDLTIDGQPWDYAAALADPSVSAAIQDEGGTMPAARHPDL
jgi:hypothetical protein